ncbi:hypothetical protein JCM30204_34330 [Dysgonomonas termitidis]
MDKIYKTAPLPFQGQKRMFAGYFAQTIKDIDEKQKISIIVDLFGGSGLLSHTAKHILPGCRVIYNDYDNYTERLRNIGKTNRLLSDIRTILANIPRDKVRIDEAFKNKVIERIVLDDREGFTDYITLSASLLFSSKYALSLEGFRKEHLYNRVKASDYDCDPDEYLKGLEIVHCDYKELYNRYKDIPGVLFIVDPPYLSTDTGTYHSDKYWKLRDYLDVLNVLSGTDYIFFTSDKSSLVELCE